MTILLWALVLSYAGARTAQAFPESIPMTAIVAMHVLPALLFALIHGTLCYGTRGMLAFVGFCVVIGNLTENFSIATGFPFGHYHFTEVMGPKILQVPILLGLAYVGIGYVSWILAFVILGNRLRPLATPIVAAFIMVAWDLSMDPIWANFVHGWVWHDGGSYFGVPISNFFGWYLTVYLIYQCFALYLTNRTTVSSLPTQYLPPAVALYTFCAAGNLLVAKPAMQFVRDASGAEWNVSAILAASALVSIFVMGAFSAFAWSRLLPPSTKPA